MWGGLFEQVSQRVLGGLGLCEEGRAGGGGDLLRPYTVNTNPEP